MCSLPQIYIFPPFYLPLYAGYYIYIFCFCLSNYQARSNSIKFKGYLRYPFSTVFLKYKSNETVALLYIFLQQSLYACHCFKSNQQSQNLLQKSARKLAKSNGNVVLIEGSVWLYETLKLNFFFMQKGSDVIYVIFRDIFDN